MSKIDPLHIHTLLSPVPFNHKETGTQTLFCVLPKLHRKQEDEDINTTQLPGLSYSLGSSGGGKELSWVLKDRRIWTSQEAEGKRDSRQQEALQVPGGEKQVSMVEGECSVPQCRLGKGWGLGWGEYRGISYRRWHSTWI